MIKKFFAKWHLTRRQQITISVVIGLTIIGIILFVWRGMYSGRTDTGRIYIDTPTVLIKQGDKVSFDIRIDSQLSIDTVTTTLQYDKSLLQYKEIKYDTSVFGASIPAIAKDNTIMIQVAKLGGRAVQGNMSLATIVFVARKDGTAKVALKAGNAVRAGEYTNPRLDPKDMK